MTKLFTDALILGRFQPFHNGHLFLIKTALDEAKNVKIVIGTTQKEHEKNHPFTAKEREEMIKLALKEEGIKNYKIFPLKDIPDDDKYVDHVRDNVGHYDIVFTWENKLNTKLFDQAKDMVVVGEKYKDIDATYIREKIAKDEKIDDLVPVSVKRYLKKIDAHDRLKKLFK